jgi:site-specific recombinase XerD
VCALCVSDLDRKTGTLRVRGKGGNERQMVLGATCLGYLLSALDQACAMQGTRAMRKSPSLALSNA